MPSFNNETSVNLKDIRVWRNVVRFLGLMWRENPVSAALLGALTIAAGIIPVGELWVTGRFVDRVSHVFDAAQSQDLDPVWTLLLLLVGLMLARTWVRLIAETIEDGVRDQVGARLQGDLLEKAYQLELAFYEEERSYDQLQRANAGLGTRLVNIYMDILEVARASVTAGGFLALLSGAHALLGPLVILAAFLSLWFKVSRARQGYIFDYDTLTPARRRLSYFRGLLTGEGYAKELRLFGLGPHFLERWRTHQEEWKAQAIGEEEREIQAAATSDLVLNVVFGAAALLLAALIAGGRMSVGAYVMMTQAVLQLQDRFEGIMYLVRNVYQDGLFSDNLFRFLDRPIDAVSSGDRPFPPREAAGVVFEGVWFRYPKGEDWVLKDVSFEVRPGETISLVGRNGAGKSTLVKLLLGLYRPDRGRILIGGVPLEEISEDELRRHISAIFQDFVHFELTLRESVGFGEVSRVDNLDRVREAARKSGLDGIAERLPSGYETFLSPRFGGVQLSGGEWQKVALARALMRDAAILVLDEPTASLDPRAELAVFREFERLARNNTAFLISHRIGTARLSDRIVVLHDGKVTEIGSHDELVRQGGEYAELFAVQAQWYRDESA